MLAGVICILIPEDFSINFWLIFKYANEGKEDWNKFANSMWDVHNAQSNHITMSKKDEAKY